MADPYRIPAPAPLVRRAPLAGLNWWFTDYLFDRFRWFRRLRGGHWERWWIDVTHSDIWMQNEHGTRPPCGMGTPVCEDWAEPAPSAERTEK